MNDKQEEKKSIDELFIDKDDFISVLESAIGVLSKIFKIEKSSGMVLFENFEGLTDKERILSLLVGKYIAAEKGIIEDCSLGVTDIARELGRPKTALSGPLKNLTTSGLVEKTNKRYKISRNRVKEIVRELSKKIGG